MKNQYSFISVLSMVIGVVIGSGIFFKADDILLTSNGNVTIGVIGFLIVGLGVLFGILVINRYAKQSTINGGIIHYALIAQGKRFAFCVAFFLITIYFPAIIIVLSSICSLYITSLLSIDSAQITTLLTCILIFITLISNAKSFKIGVGIQNITTILTLLPLVIIGLAGIFNPSITQNSSPEHLSTNINLLSMLTAIAFSFDGWIVVTSLSAEIYQSKRTLPKALISGIIFTICIYIIYFVGITKLIPPEQIISLGDEHTILAAKLVFGKLGGNLLTLFVIIAMYGGLNGATLAYLRLPKAMIDHQLINSRLYNPNHNSPQQIQGFSLKLITLMLSIFILLQFLIDNGTIFSQLNTKFDLSVLPITTNYLIYIILYLSVFKLTTKRTISLYLCVTAAVISSLLVIYGSLQSNGLLYIIIALITIFIGQIFYNKPQTNINQENLCKL